MSRGLQIKAADYVFFKRHEKELNHFVSESESYKQIHQLSDGLRYWKTINNTAIEPKRKDIVDPILPLNKKYFLDDILKRDSIDKQHYELFRQKLIETGFIEFTTLKDGTLSFTIDGLLDNCYGYAYSTTGEQPRYNDCGEIISWFKVSEHWCSWATT